MRACKGIAKFVRVGERGGGLGCDQEKIVHEARTIISTVKKHCIISNYSYILPPLLIHVL